MDGVNVAELMPLIAKLSESPGIMSAISGLAGNNQKPPPKSDALSSILDMLGSEKHSEEKKESEKRSSGLNISSIFGSQEEIKNRIILLNAVRPYLSEERRQRLEAVIRLLKLAELGALGSALGIT